MQAERPIDGMAAEQFRYHGRFGETELQCLIVDDRFLVDLGANNAHLPRFGG